MIHVDPYSRLADYEKLPKADVILVTHSHGDHFDPKAIAAARKEGTAVVLTEKAAGEMPGGIVMKNGEARTVAGIRIEAVPAYNIVHKRPTGEPFHPRGEGNGYVLSFGATRVYVAGDTEDIPEMKELKDIAIAFLPMNLPYTMSREMAALAAKAFRPKMLYPYHYGETDPSRAGPPAGRREGHRGADSADEVGAARLLRRACSRIAPLALSGYRASRTVLISNGRKSSRTPFPPSGNAPIRFSSRSVAHARLTGNVVDRAHDAVTRLDS